MLDDIIKQIIIIAITILLASGIYFVLWQLYLFAMIGFGFTQAWANPDYLSFSALMLLFGIIKYSFTYRNTKQQTKEDIKR